MSATDPKQIVRARRFRKALTQPEWLLWERLKHRLDDGLIFRRQHPVGPYILDFYCKAAALCIEVDGGLHSLGDRPERDAERDRFLGAQGLEVYRIPAAEVYADPDAVADGVRLKALARVEGL
ncbi:endonuclease domain-containing protein [Asticcacaulis sp. AND118]|uniref:endonuclease domain-containing protein n=1 Tax=Asticcacaulis sp. AND118 TaxID=2840468 RepID=UPI001D0012E8|nr:DUF559 domain-containing protein [Asticcacaulis sp. AND118]UDF03819.1 DUF559 domain-containing protein [Asticcacaulis sp. AND118]